MRELVQYVTESPERFEAGDLPCAIWGIWHAALASHSALAAANDASQPPIRCGYRPVQSQH